MPSVKKAEKTYVPILRKFLLEKGHHHNVVPCIIQKDLVPSSVCKRCVKDHDVLDAWWQSDDAWIAATEALRMLGRGADDARCLRKLYALDWTPDDCMAFSGRRIYRRGAIAAKRGIFDMIRKTAEKGEDTGKFISFSEAALSCDMDRETLDALRRKGKCPETRRVDGRLVFSVKDKKALKKLTPENLRHSTPLTDEQAAAILNVSPEIFAAWRRDERGPVPSIDGSFQRAELERWMLGESCYAPFLTSAQAMAWMGIEKKEWDALQKKKSVPGMHIYCGRIFYDAWVLEAWRQIDRQRVSSGGAADFLQVKPEDLERWRLAKVGPRCSVCGTGKNVTVEYDTHDLVVWNIMRNNTRPVLLDLPGVARMLEMSPKSVCAAVKSGKFPPARCGMYWLKDDVLDWMRSAGEDGSLSEEAVMTELSVSRKVLESLPLKPVCKKKYPREAVETLKKEFPAGEGFIGVEDVLDMLGVSPHFLLRRECLSLPWAYVAGIPVVSRKAFSVWMQAMKRAWPDIFANAGEGR